MFRNYAESRGLNKPRTFTASVSEFRKGSDSWFDGSIESVDQRLARVNKLLHTAHTHAAENPADYLAVIAELTTDRTALKELREDLVSGAATRDTGYQAPRVAALSSEERRWVTLEAARFIAEQDDRHNVAEMAERARRHAEIATSTMERPREVTAAFEAAVAKHALNAPRPRTAARTRPVFTGFHDSQMFL